ncbi:MAG TPA: putative glycoside hydrolase [Candidatus Paceibacterota bacterium]|nr:putative glycoside hydrolase [Candidatus Paceibacterota bacterium]
MDFRSFFGSTLGIGATLLLVVGAAFLFLPARTLVVDSGGPAASTSTVSAAPSPSTSSAPISAGTSTVQSSTGDYAPLPVRPGIAAPDLPYQPPLPNPPTVVRGLYLTAWSAGSPKRVDETIDLIKRNNLNGVVIDIKDYSGYVSYRTGLPAVAATGAENELRIAEPNTLLKKLHDNGLYVIGRITVFQDSVLARAHPEWSVQNKNTGKLWADRKGLFWLDPAAEPVWAYYAALANDALARGFDEVNFDYIRFPSDGDLSATQYPYWDEKTPQHMVIEKFFAYLHAHVSPGRISADLFGLTTSAADDLGIGQFITDAYPNFDYVCPMVYPSHFASGYLGYQNPALYPSEVIEHSMSEALRKLRTLAIDLSPKVPTENGSSTTSTPELVKPSEPDPAVLAGLGKLRPWLQAFDLGATYDAAKIDAQVQAAEKVLTPSGHYAGWLLWDPSNHYYNLTPQT